MPLFAGITQVGGGQGDVTVPVWSEDIGTISATWTDPAGTIWFLTDTADERGHFTTQEIAGWGAMPYEIITDPNARGGETVRFIRQQPARITWPLHIFGRTHMEFVERYRAIRRAFLMTVHRGQSGVLRIYRPDGSYREIDAFYEEGFGGEGGENWVFANPVLTLFCPDGAWRGSEVIPVELTAGGSVDVFNQFLTLSSSQVIGDTTIDNKGELVAWPDWTITGPCTAVTATNATLGLTWTVTYTLTAGQIMTIATGGPRPGVRGPAGQNLPNSLNWPTAYLWGLVPGDNDIEFVVAGASAGTKIRLDYNPLYEGA